MNELMTMNCCAIYNFSDILKLETLFPKEYNDRTDVCDLCSCRQLS